MNVYKVKEGVSNIGLLELREMIIKMKLDSEIKYKDIGFDGSICLHNFLVMAFAKLTGLKDQICHEKKDCKSYYSISVLPSTDTNKPKFILTILHGDNHDCFLVSKLNLDSVYPTAIKLKLNQGSYDQIFNDIEEAKEYVDEIYNSCIKGMEKTNGVIDFTKVKESKTNDFDIKNYQKV